jgi:hypothetical protein
LDFAWNRVRPAAAAFILACLGAVLLLAAFVQGAVYTYAVALDLEYP